MNQPPEQEFKQAVQDNIKASKRLAKVGTDNLPSIHANDIKGIDCPACGHPCLMLMSGGYVTCSLAECPNPDFATALESIIKTKELKARITELEDLLLHMPEYSDAEEIVEKRIDFLKHRSWNE